MKDQHIDVTRGAERTLLVLLAIVGIVAAFGAVAALGWLR